jgi:two-component system, cell cycle response regulator CpdR
MEILIGEDDADTAFLYSKLLEERGHNVVVTKDGRECLDVYYDKAKSTNSNSNSNPFDAVILDHKMPVIDGFQVAKEIVSINPNQRIIIASGYSEDIFKEASDHYQIPLEVLQKPFSNNLLIEMVESTHRFHLAL